MIGTTDTREKVIKLWEGLCSSIQQALYRDGYNPDISTWDEVIQHAKVIEIAEGVASKDHCQNNPPSKPNNNGQVNGSSPSKGKGWDTMPERSWSWAPNRDHSINSNHFNRTPRFGSAKPNNGNGGKFNQNGSSNNRGGSMPARGQSE